jgi:hypothetical protein
LLLEKKEKKGNVWFVVPLMTFASRKKREEDSIVTFGYRLQREIDHGLYDTFLNKVKGASKEEATLLLYPTVRYGTVY